jgi:hypothetical protein
MGGVAAVTGACFDRGKGVFFGVGWARAVVEWPKTKAQQEISATETEMEMRMSETFLGDKSSDFCENDFSGNSKRAPASQATAGPFHGYSSSIGQTLTPAIVRAHDNPLWAEEA